MNWKTILLATFILVGCGGLTEKQVTFSKLPSIDLVTARLEDSIFHKTKYFPNGTQLSLSLIKNGQATFYGIIRSNDTLYYLDNANSAFEIGSISKVFTSRLLAKKVIQDSLNIYLPVRDFISIRMNKNPEFTLIQLANHTSGLPRLPHGMFEVPGYKEEDPYATFTNLELEKYLEERLALNRDPGLEYEYSNLGVGLLGYVLSAIEDKTYDQLLQESIFNPMNMTNSSIDKNLVSNLVYGQDEDGNSVSNWDLGSLQGAGGILSTASDLSKFVLYNLDSADRIDSLQRIKTFSISDQMDVSLGWHIIYTKSGDTWYWHNGGTGGYTSSLAMDMERKNAVIVLSNVSAFSDEMGRIDELCFDLMRALED